MSPVVCLHHICIDIAIQWHYCRTVAVPSPPPMSHAVAALAGLSSVIYFLEAGNRQLVGY